MRVPRKLARVLLVALLLVSWIAPGIITLAMADDIPPTAIRYRSELVRQAHYAWGLGAPISVLAAQIHQESHWNKNAKSAFASGLTQFTPDTAEWISGAYPKSLGANDPLNPQWAIRAMVTYDKQLYDEAHADTPCDKMWKALWGYNGGKGWVNRDERLAAKSGANPLVASEVEPFNAGRNAAMFKQNRDYPRFILLKWQPVYALWGGDISCQ